MRTRDVILPSGLAIVLAVASPAPASASGPAPGIYVVFDASGSMWAELPDKSRRIEAAREVLKEFARGDFAGHELAVRVYGHRREGDCTDTELLVPFGPAEKVLPRIVAEVGAIKPLGKTPITLSLTKALQDFGDREGSIILISDGIESCDADPCALVRQWAARNVKIRVHVVGLGLDEKSRSAMACISEAAGTEYRDAASAQELREGLASIKEQAVSGAFYLEGVDDAGQALSVEGTLVAPDGRSVAVASNARHDVDPGRYRLSAGVRTRNGGLYRPATRDVEVAAAGDTRVRLVVPVPPRLRVRFVDGGEERPLHGQVEVHRSGSEPFSFRAVDEVFVDEGAYELHASPDPENRLTTRVELGPGDRKVATFELVRVVRVRIAITPRGGDRPYPGNSELWQGGKMASRVHRTNGADVLPGLYDVHLPIDLGTRIVEGVTVGTARDQELELVVPAGHVRFVYVAADGTPEGKGRRCFVSREGGKERLYRASDERLPFPPGRYVVTGWGGSYVDAAFEVRDGDDIEVTLRPAP